MVRRSGVQPDCLAVEIREAYRHAMMENHPYGVASMSAKLKAVAEEESKNINAAFAEAKQQFGFR